MRELFEICQNTQFFNFFGAFLSFEGGETSQKRRKIVCSDLLFSETLNGISNNIIPC